MTKINTDQKRLSILEYYFKYQNLGFELIADKLNISPVQLEKLVRKYKNDGCLIIPSKMN